MTTPLITIITVVKNAKDLITTTLSSVAGQRTLPMEHIVVDGLSTDGTVQILSASKIPNMRWVSESDNGIYDAMNKGITLARGEWLLFLGAGDFLANDQILADLFTSPINSAIDLIYGKAAYSDGTQFTPKLDVRTNLFNTIHHQAALYRRRLFNNFRYRTDLQIVADYELNYLIYRQKKETLFVNKIIAICALNGISQRTSLISSQLDAFKARQRHISWFLNYLFLMAGMTDLALAKSFPKRHTKT